jgi:RNA polymerase-binding transcription factor DksA
LLNDREDLASEAFEKLEDRTATFAETATEEFDHDLSFDLLSSEEHMLHEVDAALSRISNGTYGVCEETGRKIPRARLRAIPWTRNTKDVPERLESQEPFSRPHIASLISTSGRKPGGMPSFKGDDEHELKEGPELSRLVRRDEGGMEEASSENTLTFEDQEPSHSDEPGQPLNALSKPSWRSLIRQGERA